MHKYILAQTSLPPCLTGKGNGFSPFGEPQTRGAAGPFQIAVVLKSPSVYEYGDEDLGRRERRKRRKIEGGRDQRVKKEGGRERFCVSEVLFLPALWPLAGFMHWI